MAPLLYHKHPLAKCIQKRPTYSEMGRPLYGPAKVQISPEILISKGHANENTKRGSHYRTLKEASHPRTPEEEPHTTSPFGKAATR